MLSLPISKRAEAELTRRKRIQARPAIHAPEDWRGWLKEIYPAAVTAPFARRHEELWEWIEALHPGTRPRPFIAVWPRGGAKSTTAELGAVRVGAKQSRKYIWYVSSTQDKADKHVETIGSKLESDRLEMYYPKLASRQLGKYGHSRGWRRERLRTASGLTIDALGMDTGARGAKVEDQRPDMIILDDLDELGESAPVTLKRIEMLTKTILPAGSNDCAILFIQNLVHPDSIASRLADGRADFLSDRILSGPFLAVEGLTYEQREGKFVITGGQATWEGQNLAVCQDQVTTWGLTSFLQEAQQQVEQIGGIWDHVEFQYCDWKELPPLVKIVVWVDPAVTSTDQSDCQGIQADGKAVTGRIYRLFSWEGITSPEDALERAINKAIEMGALTVGVETDQGGDTWQSVFARAVEKIRKAKDAKWEAWLADWKTRNPNTPEKDWPAKPVIKWPSFASDKAGHGYGSKVERNAQMLADYERGNIIHVRGTHTTLEKALRRFPLMPLDLVDAAFWSWHDLTGGSGWLEWARRKAEGAKQL